MKLSEPYALGNLELRNRLVMPPMCTYMVGSHDGKATGFHQVHYGSRAIGGVGLVIVEATAVLPEGRISDNDLGIWDDAQVPALASVADRIHEGGAKCAIQIGHAGRKCQATDGIDSIFAPSAVAYDRTYRVPEAMDDGDIEKVLFAFGQAARRADEAGFDGLEIHAAHGYLINQFISPETNKRNDRYADPSMFLSLVLRAVEPYWPKCKPLWVRVSATDYSPGGYGVEQLVELLSPLKSMIDAVHVSSGGVVPVVPPSYPGYQVGFAGKIRKALDLPVIAVGMLSDPDLAEYVLQSGAADLVAVGRGLLRNPNWLLEASFRHDRTLPGRQPDYLRRAFPR
jgi:NADPH2 dehydrogenase